METSIQVVKIQFKYTSMCKVECTLVRLAELSEPDIRNMGLLRKLQSNDKKMEATQIDSISAFADHLVENNHSPSLQNPVPLHFAPKSRKLDILESTEIKKAIINKDHILNNQQDIKNSTLIDFLIDKI